MENKLKQPWEKQARSTKIPDFRIHYKAMVSQVPWFSNKYMWGPDRIEK